MNLPELRISRFREIIAKAEKSISILFSQFDPDAAAAALAMAWIISKLRPQNGIEIKIFYAGDISHPQNVMLANRLDLINKMRSMTAFSENDNKNVILVDSSSLHDARLGLPNGITINPIVVIDHHRNTIAEREGTFIWIEDMGAASTLVVELAVSLEIQFDESSQSIATMLAIGIHTDTNSLTDYYPRDLEAYTTVAKTIPRQELTPLFRYPLPVAYFDNLKRALTNEVIHGGILVTHVGHIAPSSSDDISTIAEEFIRRTGVIVVIVWGIMGRKVRLSARSVDMSRPLELFLAQTFPDVSYGAKQSPDGRGIGGAQFELEIAKWMMTPHTTKEIEAFVSAAIQSRVFNQH